MPAEVNVKVTSPVAKFFIGALAGCAAIVIPRLSSFLISGKGSDVNYFPEPYIMGAIAFSILIGLLVVVMEYKIPRPPKETLFAALAIPGLIAGSLNTVIESNEANITHQKAIELSRDVRRGNSIDIEKIEAIEIVPIVFSQSTSTPSNERFSFNVFSAAYAGEHIRTLLKKPDSLGVSVQREVPKFAVSIGTYKTRKEAMKEARIAKKRNALTTLIKTKKGYELLSSDKILSEMDATIEAIRIKNTLGITPKLLQIK